ncbi:hypothetical protein SEMRO_2528_G330331.1 [Seminavis robusta]|uniref:Uncharacterized protein n=1 Tax=Seminavis robusta TaxID=568900 RepID=A0A9N8EZ66_9STRA|nr:hypothetical protein SEMRO_2528_G330331.1 [Seminavis robusta]|eukprot:Sro2528_g330331.1  (132) ;mRNA; f:3299-3694
MLSLARIQLPQTQIINVIVRAISKTQPAHGGYPRFQSRSWPDEWQQCPWDAPLPRQGRTLHWHPPASSLVPRPCRRCDCTTAGLTPEFHELFGRHVLLGTSEEHLAGRLTVEFALGILTTGVSSLLRRLVR